METSLVITLLLGLIMPLIAPIVILFNTATYFSIVLITQRMGGAVKVIVGAVSGILGQSLQLSLLLTPPLLPVSFILFLPSGILPN